MNLSVPITLLLATSAGSEIRTRTNYVCNNRKNSVILRTHGGYDMQLQHDHSLNDNSCELVEENSSPVPRSLFEDPLIGLFNADDVKEKKELLDFLYDKAVLSANKYDRTANSGAECNPQDGKKSRFRSKKARGLQNSTKSMRQVENNCLHTWRHAF